MAKALDKDKEEVEEDEEGEQVLVKELGKLELEEGAGEEQEREVGGGGTAHSQDQMGERGPSRIGLGEGVGAVERLRKGRCKFFNSSKVSQLLLSLLGRGGRQGGELRTWSVVALPS